MLVIADILDSLGRVIGSLLVHFLFRHAFFLTLGPPKHFRSWHSGPSSQFDYLQTIHWPQRPLECFR